MAGQKKSYCGEKGVCIWFLLGEGRGGGGQNNCYCGDRGYNNPAPPNHYFLL